MTGGPLTILQLTHQGGPAGSTQSIFNLSQYLARRGHRVLVGCREDVLLARLARDAGLPVVPLTFMPRAVLTGALRDVLERERVDVVNATAPLDRRALRWLRGRGRLPQAFVVPRRTMPLTSPAELLPVGWTADRTIAVSGAVARALRRRLHPGARLRVVPNGIALERVDAPVPPHDLAAARAALGDPGGRPVVAIVSRLKDQHIVLQALPSVERGVVVACVGVEPDHRLRQGAIAWCSCLSSIVRSPFITWRPWPPCRPGWRDCRRPCSKRWRSGCRSWRRPRAATWISSAPARRGSWSRRSIRRRGRKGSTACSLTARGRAGWRRPAARWCVASSHSSGPRSAPRWCTARRSRAVLPGDCSRRQRPVSIPGVTSLLLAQDFPPMGGGIARLQGELARRYPPARLIVSTPQDPDSAEVDARFGGAVDRLPIGRRRTKALPGLLLWSRRAASLA